MSKDKIELPDYITIDTTSGIDIKIDEDGFLDSLPTSTITDNLSYRNDYEPLDDYSDSELFDELKCRCYNFVQNASNEDVYDEFFDRNLMRSTEICDSIVMICKHIKPRGYIGKEDMKKMINEWIDDNIIKGVQ